MFAWLSAIHQAFRVRPEPVRHLSGTWTEEERQFVAKQMFDSVTCWAMVRATDQPMLGQGETVQSFKRWADLDEMVKKAPAYQINARWDEIRRTFGLNGVLTIPAPPPSGFANPLSEMGDM